MHYIHKFVAVFFGVFMTLSTQYDMEYGSRVDSAAVYTDTCFGVEEMYCTFEFTQTKDEYYEEEYNTRTITIERTFTILE